MDSPKKGLDKTVGMIPPKDAAKSSNDKTKVMDAMPAEAEALRQRLIALGLDPNAAKAVVPPGPKGGLNGTMLVNNPRPAPQSVAPPPQQQQQERPGTTKLVRSNVLAPLQQSPPPGGHRHPGSSPNQPQAQQQMPPGFRGQPGSSPNQSVAAPHAHPPQVAPPHIPGSVAPPAMHRMPQSVMPPGAAPPMKTCTPSKDPRLIMMNDPNGSQASGFRVLRDTLFSKGLPKVLAISSAEEGEGKTTCAVNLALAIAEQRQGPMGKILLVDGNFAQPALVSLLGIDTSTPATAGPFILAALTPTLHIASIPSSQSYVDFSTLARLFDSFHRAGYQHIILDTPPIEGSPEGTLLLNLAGGVLLVTRAGQSTTAAFKKAVERVGDKAIGVALMDAPSPNA